MATEVDQYPWHTWDVAARMASIKITDAVKEGRHPQHIHKAISKLHREALKLHRAINAKEKTIGATPV